MTDAQSIICDLFDNVKYVNTTTVIYRVDPDSPRVPIWSKAGIPGNHTKLADYVIIQGGAWSFKEKKSNGGTTKKTEVYYTFKLVTNVDVSELLSKLSFEYAHVNGTILHIKPCQPFQTVTPLMIFFLYNRTHQDVVEHEVRYILTMARDEIIGGGMLDMDASEK